MDRYTKDYLNYIKATKDIDMSEHYELFMKYVPKGSKILDAGFGSGRDIAFFKQHYDVTGIDLSNEFVTYVKENIHPNVYQMDILKLKFEEKFDAIWSCASQVHFDSNQLILSFDNYYKALKDSGILYSSIKIENDANIIENVVISVEELVSKLTLNYIVVETKLSLSKKNDQKWYSLVLKKN
jgi:SAM-dependent methyltransferase